LRIVVHDYSGHAFPVQLARELARRGHDVLHLHCPSYTTGRGALERLATDPPNFAAEGVPLSTKVAKYSWRRPFQELRYAWLARRRVAAFAPDVLVSCNVPLLANRFLMAMLRGSAIRVVHWHQDIYSAPIAALARQRIPVAGGLVAWVAERFERAIVRRSAFVVPISHAFLPTLDAWGVPPERVRVIENWAPLEEIDPVPRDNPWARSHGLLGPTILYAGTLGLKHDPELLFQLACRVDGGASVVVLSEGRGADYLRARAVESPAPNLRLLPFQPYETLPQVLGSADVLAVILEPSAATFSVPSKVLSYHCAGRAIVASLTRDNLAARIIEDNETGLVVDPGDIDAFAAAARRLLDDTELRSRMATNARAYAKRTFDIRAIGDEFEDILVGAVDAEPRRRHSQPTAGE